MFTLSLTPLKNFIGKYVPSKVILWFDNQEMKRQAMKGNGLVPKEELKLKYCEALLSLAQTNKISNLGDYLEFGVCHGSSLACMHQVLQELDFKHIRLFGFDSFEGLPEEAKTDNEGWYPGLYKSEYSFTQKFLTLQGIDWKRTILVKGWFRDTLNDALKKKHRITNASIIMIDSDLYSSAKIALNFCASLIQDQAIIFFDEWHSFIPDKQDKGEKLAFTEFLKENPQFTARELGSYTLNTMYDTSIIFLVTRNQ